MSLATAPIDRASARRPSEVYADPIALPTRVQLVARQLRTRPRIAYGVIVVAVIFGIFMAQLLLSIALSEGAYNISKLQGEQRDLTRVTSSLNERLQTVASTQNLAANARALGMVSDSSPAFLSLTTGKVVGPAAVAAVGQAGGKHVANGAGGAIPNSLLTDIPLLTKSDSGHGGTNAGDSVSDDADSTGTTTTTTGSTTTDPGALLSPTTH